MATVEGSISTFDADGYTHALASHLGIAERFITLTVTAGSVLVQASVVPPHGTDAQDLLHVLSGWESDVEAASQALGVPVLSITIAVVQLGEPPPTPERPRSPPPPTLPSPLFSPHAELPPAPASPPSLPTPWQTQPPTPTTPGAVPALPASPDGDGRLIEEYAAAELNTDSEGAGLSGGAIAGIMIAGLLAGLAAFTIALVRAYGCPSAKPCVRRLCCTTLDFVGVAQQRSMQPGYERNGGGDWPASPAVDDVDDKAHGKPALPSPVQPPLVETASVLPERVASKEAHDAERQSEDGLHASQGTKQPQLSPSTRCSSWSSGRAKMSAVPPGMPPLAETIEQSDMGLYAARHARVGSDADPAMRIMLEHSMLSPMGSLNQLEPQFHETTLPLAAGGRLNGSQQEVANGDHSISTLMPLADDSVGRSMSRIVMPTALERSRQDAIMLRI